MEIRGRMDVNQDFHILMVDWIIGFKKKNNFLLIHLEDMVCSPF